MKGSTLCLLLLLAPACSLNPAVYAGQPISRGARTTLDERNVNLGGGLSVRAHPIAEARGVVFGIEELLVDEVARTACCQWRVNALAGVSHQPVRGEQRIGIEALAHAGFGEVLSADRRPSAFALGPRVGVPIRLFKPWTCEQEPLFAPSLMIVPELGGTFFFPTDGEDRSVVSEGFAMISLRGFVFLDVTLASLWGDL